MISNVIRTTLSILEGSSLPRPPLLHVSTGYFRINCSQSISKITLLKLVCLLRVARVHKVSHELTKLINGMVHSFKLIFWLPNQNWCFSVQRCFDIVFRFRCFCRLALGTMIKFDCCYPFSQQILNLSYKIKNIINGNLPSLARIESPAKKECIQSHNIVMVD